MKVDKPAPAPLSSAAPTFVAGGLLTGSNGMVPYFRAKDRKPGDKTGDGFKHIRHAATP